MSNEISAARGIGSSIAKGTGSIPTLKFKKTKGEKETQTKTTPKTATSKPKASPKTTKTKSGRKQVFEGEVVTPTYVEPRFVPSERVGDIVDAEIVETPKAIGAPRKSLGGGQRWEEFKSYVEANKSGKLTPPTKLD